MSFRIIRNDITKVAADAIVNTANPEVAYAAGVGQAAITPAFALDAKYIIHTVGPAWVDGNHGEFDDLRKCYENRAILDWKKGTDGIIVH